jgi:predicted  nucleic acid-binding Zn ribbon protein
MDCNLEVRPEDLALSEDLVEAIARWRTVYDAVYWLWLDSGAYEAWAREQLADITSPVNAEGRSVRQELDAVRRCYYWCFQDDSADDYEPMRTCPGCGASLQAYPRGVLPQWVCEGCSLAAAGADEPIGVASADDRPLTQGRG